MAWRVVTLLDMRTLFTPFFRAENNMIRIIPVWSKDWPVGSHRFEREDRTFVAFELPSLRLAVGQLTPLENCSWTCGEVS